MQREHSDDEDQADRSARGDDDESTGRAEAEADLDHWSGGCQFGGGWNGIASIEMS
jgi:hypothetical protein